MVRAYSQEHTYMSRHTNRNRHSHRPAAALWFDCSMLAEDDTVFLLPHDQGLRYFDYDHHYGVRSRGDQTPAPNLWGQNQRFPHQFREDETLILNFPVRSVSEETIAKHIDTRLVRDHAVDAGGVCVVCQDDLVEGNGRIARLDCGHEYHEGCINKWLNHNNVCPMCKASVIAS